MRKLKCKDGEVEFKGKCYRNVPYEDTAKVFINKKNKTAIVGYIRSLGKGWCETTLGNLKMKFREPCNIKSILSSYPNYEEVSTFTSLSYHKPISNKISKYGTHRYNLQYSQLKDIDSPYKLLNPLKTSEKKRFGKIIDKIKFKEWEYVVIDWKPSDGSEKLWVKHSVENPLTGEHNIISESEKFDVKDADKVIKIFKDKVNEIRK